ncbi:MAG TPA: hypothetical protein VFP72_23985 [Kineosporiaceae bacterium]|nr:hypothetical protein [Kineosporiaceae bacterium]
MRVAVDLGQGVTQAWTTIVDFVPRLVVFLVILLVGWLIAKVLRKAVDTVLERVGFDRVVERGGVAAAMDRTRYDASSLVAALVYYAVLLIALELAFGVFGPNPVSDLLAGVVRWLPRAVVAIIIVVVAAAIAQTVRELIDGALGGLTYGRVLAVIAQVFILGLGIIAALNQIGVATTVTVPVLITVLATIGGILVVGVGGGLVRPMQSRWERWLGNAELERTRVLEQAAAYRRGRADAPHPEGAQPGDPADRGPVATPGAATGATTARTDDPAPPRTGGARKL